MDDVKLLRNHHDAQPGPSAETTAAARARLLHHARTAPAAGRDRLAFLRNRRRIFVPAGFGLAAAAVAAGLIVTSGTTPATVPKPRATVTLSAGQVLLAAATRLESEPATTGRYLHTVYRNTVVESVGLPGHPFLVGEVRVSESWSPRAPEKDDGYGWYQRERTGPLSQADTEAWKKAGSPPQVPLLVPLTAHAKVVGVPPARIAPSALNAQIAGKGPLSSNVSKAGSKENSEAGNLGGKNVTVNDIQRLPADPEKLKSHLLTMYHGQAGPDVFQTGRKDLWLFAVARDLITGFFPADQTVRAAAYRMLASVPGVRVIGSVTAPDGTPGTGIAITETQERRGVVEHRLIIDPATGRMLAMQEVAVRPAADFKALPPGTAYAESVYLTDEWTDATPHRTTS